MSTSPTTSRSPRHNQQSTHDTTTASARNTNTSKKKDSDADDETPSGVAKKGMRWAWSVRRAFTLRMINVTTLIIVIIMNLLSYYGMLPTSVGMEGVSRYEALVGDASHIPDIEPISNMWWIMYALMAIVCVYSLIPMVGLPNVLITNRMRFLFIAVNVVDFIWLILAGIDENIPSWVSLIPAGIQASILSLLHVSLRTFSSEQDNVYDYIGIKMPISIYASWIMLVCAWGAASLIENEWINLGLLGFILFVAGFVAMVWTDFIYLVLPFFAAGMIATDAGLNTTIRALGWAVIGIVFCVLILSFVVRLLVWTRRQWKDSQAMTDTDSDETSYYDSESTDASSYEVPVV